MQFPEIVFQLKKYITSTSPIFLVGGAVRDAILGRTIKDFDFVCNANAREIASKFADENNGAFFMLDEERNTARVILAQRSPDQVVFDFAQIRGESIEADLLERDFSINSMAVNLDSPQVIIDPTKGGRDLQQRWLRPVKSTSIEDDPVRAIRAVRYAVNLGLKIEPETAHLIRVGAQKLDRVSVERKRDEIFKILEGQSIGSALQLLDKFLIFDKIGIPVKEDFELACRQTNVLHEMISLLSGKSGVDKNASFYRTSTLLRLGRFKEQLYRHFYQKNQTGRDRKSLLFIYQIIKNDKVNDLLNRYCRSMALSMDEIEIVQVLAENSDYLKKIDIKSKKPDNRSIHLFYNPTGEAGIDLILLELAEYASRLSSEFSQECWLNLLENCEKLIEAWYFHPEVVAPKPFLNGNDLMFHFDLTPGPLIGEIIDAMKEEQAAGNIKTKEDALEWVDLRLQRDSL